MICVYIMVDSILNAPWWPWSRTTKVSSTTVVASAESTSTVNSIISTASDYDYDWGITTPSPLPPLFSSISVNLTGNVIISDKFNISSIGTNIFDNYSNNFIINDTTDFSSSSNTSGSGSSSSNAENDFNWWNCTGCRLFLDATSSNNSSINQTRFGDDNESTIYLIQVILTALILGVVILATVIGKCFYSFFYPFSHFILNLYDKK